MAIYFLEIIKNESDIRLSNGDFENIENDKIYIIGGTLFAGILSSMVGVGGGIVMIPLMLSLGLNPRVLVINIDCYGYF
jgi:hypothetical protein